MKPTPQTSIHGLLARLNARNGEPLTDFERAQFKRDADNLAKVNRGEGYVVHAAIAALDFDAEGVRKSMAIAIPHSPADMAWGNYAVSLRHLGLFQEAADAALKSSDAAPTDLALLQDTIEAHVTAIRLTKAIELKREFEKRSAGRSPKLRTVDPEALTKSLKAVGLSEETFSEALRLAMGLLLEEKVRHELVDVVCETGGNPAVCCVIKVMAPLEKVRSLDHEFSARLDSALPDLSHTQLFVSIEPVFDYERKSASAA